MATATIEMTERERAERNEWNVPSAALHLLRRAVYQLNEINRIAYENWQHRGPYHAECVWRERQGHIAHYRATLAKLRGLFAQNNVPFEPYLALAVEHATT